MVALTFVKNFEWDEDETDSLDKMRGISANAYGIDEIKEAVSKGYSLFKDVEIKSYADIAIKHAMNQLTSKGTQLTITTIKPEIITIYTNETFYTDPLSFSVDSGSLASRNLEPLEDYVFPNVVSPETKATIEEPLKEPLNEEPLKESLNEEPLKEPLIEPLIEPLKEPLNEPLMEPGFTEVVNKKKKRQNKNAKKDLNDMITSVYAFAEKK